MKKRRVVITGLGVVAANGIGVGRFWDAIESGKSGVDKITSFDTSEYPMKIAAEVKNFNPQDYLDEKTIKQTSRFAQFALVAAKEAMGKAQLNPGDYDPERIGVAIGTSIGGLDFAFDQHSVFLKEGFLSMNTFITSIINPSAAARVIALTFGAKGACPTFCSTCVASADTIGYGFNLIRNGDVDVMISGGSDAPISPPIFAGFYLGRILSLYNEDLLRAPRPFDSKRNGTVLAEGSAILILEELDHALERNANIYAEIVGYGSTCDAYHVVIPDPEGTQGKRAIELALNDAGVDRNEIDYINAHGTATIKNDQIETLIIKKVFGKKAYKIPVSATKSITGHLLGASGAIEALICILSIQNSVIPPTINYKDSDPECDLDYVPLKARKKDLNIAISNSFGFGGLNAVLAFRKYKT